MRNKLVLLAITTAACAGVVAGALTAVADTSEPAPDPAGIPLPAFDDAATDPAKAVVLDVDFASRTSASVGQTAVSIQRAHTHVGDPPILRLVLKDPDGATLEQMNAWSPLWNFYTDGGHEHVSILSSGSASFIVPFRPDLAAVTIHDIALNQDILTTDVTGTIHNFCAANPADPDCLEADLEVASITPFPPDVPVVGTAVPLTVTNSVSNAGPDGPVDAVVTTAATAGPGVTITPTSPPSVDVEQLEVGVPRQVDRSYSLLCTQPGMHTIDFTTSIAPKIAAVVDPNASNDTKTVTVSVDCATPVAFNIRPGSSRNEVNLAAGVLPTVVVTSSAGEYGLPVPFDASSIDVSTVRFGVRSLVLTGGGTPELDGRRHLIRSFGLDEEPPDADRDLLLHFDPRQAGITISDTEACVRGRYIAPDGTNLGFFGCDDIYVVPNTHSI